MPSAFIVKRETKLDGRNRGKKRHIVRYRLGGREAAILHGGSFLTEREARMRQIWIAGELAAGLVPDLHLLEHSRPPPTVAESRRACGGRPASTCPRGRASCTGWRSNRVLPLLGDRPRRRAHIADVHAGRDARRRRRSGETIRKSSSTSPRCSTSTGVDPTLRATKARSGCRTKSTRS